MDSKIVSKLKGRPFKIDTDIIHNKYVLYAILIISILDLIVLSNSQNYESVAIFFLVGFLTYYFNKNMIVILCISLFVTNLLKYGLKIRINEGFEEKEEDETKKENMDAENDKNADIKENSDKQEKNKKENTDKTEVKTENEENPKSNNPEEENKKQGENSNKEADKKPSETEINNIKNADMVTSLNLNNDNKGLEGLENQTMQLINTQKKLIENMKKLEPMLSDAQTFIDKFQNIGIR